MIGRELVAAIRHAAAARGLRRVRRANVAVGCLREIDLAALDLCFRAAAPGSGAEETELHVEQPLATAFCLACRAEVVVRRRADACPNCGGHRLHLLAGDEVRVLECEGD